MFIPGAGRLKMLKQKVSISWLLLLLNIISSYGCNISHYKDNPVIIEGCLKVPFLNSNYSGGEHFKIINNTIEKLEIKTFHFMGKAETLDIINNDVSSLKKDFLAELKELQELNVKERHLKIDRMELPSSLEIARFQVNYLSQGYPKLKSSLRELTVVDTIIEKGRAVFRVEANSKLETLTLRNCSLTQLAIAPNLNSSPSLLQLNGIPNLKHLNLSHNLFTYITHNNFEQCSKLETVILDHNKILFVHPNTFDNKPQLQLIDLSYNELIEVAPWNHTNMEGNNSNISETIRLDENVLRFAVCIRKILFFCILVGDIIFISIYVLIKINR